MIVSLSKQVYLLDHCQGLRPLRKLTLIVLGVNWASMKKAAKMHAAVWQHLLTHKKTQFLLLRIYVLERTVLIYKDACTRMFIMASVFEPKNGEWAKEISYPSMGEWLNQ